MARFEIKTTVPNWNGVSAGVAFANGRAVITSDTPGGLAALSYFKQAGYGIAPLDSDGVDAVLARANEDPTAEHARLTAEIVSKRNRLELDKLRDESKQLDEKIFKADAERAETDEKPAADEGELLAPPAETAGVAEWRKWAIDSGRASEDEARAMDKTAIVKQYGSAYDAERDAQLKASAATGQGAA